MTRIPTLLYHELLPASYPTDDGSENVLAVRFAAPVRLDSLRIHPEGVGALGGIGSTYPDTFTARVLLNTSTREPVNALAPSIIQYDGRAGWSQHYALDMPDGVTTRMILIIGAFDRLSLSIYGSGPGSGIVEEQESKSGHISAQSKNWEKEEWSWLSDWAGGVTGLLDLLDDSVDASLRDRALASLELATNTEQGSTVLDSLVAHPTALAYLLLLPSIPPQPILQRLFADAQYALHPEVVDYLPTNHPLQRLATGTEEERRSAAWACYPAKGSLEVLLALGPGDWDIEVPGSGGLSRLAKLMHALQAWQGSWERYEKAVDLLLTTLQDASTRRMRYLASQLPRIILTSRLHGSDRQIPINSAYADQVLAALLAAPPILDGKPTAAQISELAKPFLPFEPFTSLFAAPAKHTPSLKSIDDPEERALGRFARSLNGPVNGYAHSLTTAQLISAIAPDLLASLSTAAQPPFGISPTASMVQQNSSSASAFAGKVYSSHEFRTREPVGQAGAGTAGGAGNVAGMQLAESSGGGLGVATARMSRPASRHVDAFAP